MSAVLALVGPVVNVDYSAYRTLTPDQARYALWRFFWLRHGLRLREEQLDEICHEVEQYVRTLGVVTSPADGYPAQHWRDRAREWRDGYDALHTEMLRERRLFNWKYNAVCAIGAVAAIAAYCIGRFL